MAFVKRDIKDQSVQFPNRFAIIAVSGNTYDITPVPGTVTEPGTPVNKDLLQRYEDLLVKIQPKVGEGKSFGKALEGADLDVWRLANGAVLTNLTSFQELFEYMGTDFPWVAPLVFSTTTSYLGAGSMCYFHDNLNMYVLYLGNTSNTNCHVFSSTDGVTWTYRTTYGADFMGPRMHGWAYSPTLNRAMLIVMADKIAYTGASGWNSTLLTATEITYNHVKWMPYLSKFLICANSSTPVGILRESSDGIASTSRSSFANTDRIYDVAYSPTLNIYVACGRAPSTNRVLMYSSADATTWTETWAPTNRYNSVSVEWVGYLGKFVMICSSASGGTTWVFYTSVDGINWVQVSSGVAGSSSLTESDKIVVFEDKQRIMLSNVQSATYRLSYDGVAWSTVNFLNRPATTGSIRGFARKPGTNEGIFAGYYMDASSNALGRIFKATDLITLPDWDSAMPKAYIRYKE